MRHEMRAEYAPGNEVAAGAPVKIWHMVREEQVTALCGRELGERAATQSDELWGRTSEPFCHSCGAVYLREVP